MPKTLRYVRVGGKYRFCEVGKTHASMVTFGERVDSAGLLKYREPESYSQGRIFYILKDSSALTLEGKKPIPEDGKKISEQEGWVLSTRDEVLGVCV